MRKLDKTAEPQILKENAAAWTVTLLLRIEAGERISSNDSKRYRHAQVKAALVLETKGKCAYCESKLLHIHHGDVEHISPKSLDPEKIYQWKNLTLACEICNQNKSNKDPKALNIIDPYATDPADHMAFCGPIIFASSPILGKSTIAILELNRAALLERRRDRLEKILLIVENILNDALPVDARKAIYKDFLKNEAGEDSEFSAMAKSVADQIIKLVPNCIVQ